MGRKNTLLRLASILLVLLICVSGVFANGSNESKSSGKVKLTFVETMTSPARTQVLQALIDEYEAQNPNIEIELISPPYEQSDNKLTMMLNSNQEIDICETRDYTVKQFVNNGKLRDLTPYLNQWEGKDDLLDLTMEAACTVDNTPYLLPQCIYVKGLFVRTDILNKYGIAMPTTMRELYDASIAITGKAPEQYGYSLRGKANCFKVSDIMMLGDIENVSSENMYLTNDGQYTYGTAAGKKALADYVELYKKACPKDSINWGFNEQINGFVSGTTPFLIQDPDTLGVMDGQLTESQFTVVPVPVGTTGKRCVDYGFAGLSIPTTSKHPDEAWNFIKWISSAEKNAEFCKSYGPLPINKSSFNNDPYFSSGVYKAWADELQDPLTELNSQKVLYRLLGQRNA